MKTGSTLMDQVRARVDADESLAVEAGLLIMAALEGDVALTQALSADGSHAAPISTAADARTASVSKAATGVFVNSIAVQGFGGIGPRCTLELAPGPGLTLVVGRNGSGKSSSYRLMLPVGAPEKTYISGTVSSRCFAPKWRVSWLSS